MLSGVAEFIRKLVDIQEKTTDVEFVRSNLQGIISRQTWAAYKNGSRNITTDFIDAIEVIYPELHITAALARQEISKAKIAKKTATE